ncbi:MAG: MFS transporter [Nitrospinae bacterium]|nr:MFS transporter [Nitrospinota bacterium]
MDASTPAGAHASFAERPVIWTVALGSMLAQLNSTLIAVAMPEVMDEFHAGLGSAGWLITAYLITMATLQPVAGKIGDRVGRGRLVLGGLMFFGLASLAAAVAPNLWVLIAFRVLQAVAGALIVPNGAALVRELVPEARRGGRFGLIGAAVALAAAVGPAVGSVLITAAGWRAVFYVNLVLVLPALVIGWRSLPGDRATVARGRFDVLGAIMLPVMLSVTAALLMFATRGTLSRTLIVGGIVVITIATVFLWWEFKHPDPVLQPRLFRRRAFVAANGGIALGNLAMYTVLLSVPLLLASRKDSSTLQAGIVLTVMSAAMIVVSPLGGRLADTFGRRLPATAGLAVLTLGAVPLAVAGPEITLPPLVVGLVLVGCGIGMATPGLWSTAVESVSREEAGVASGIYSTSRYLGSIIGSAILAGLLGADRSDLTGLGRVFVIVLAAAALATVVGLGLRARPEADHAESSGITPSPPGKGWG